MAFNKDNFTPIGGQSARGKAPMAWSYASADAIADMDTSGYFNEVSSMVKPGDQIRVVVVSDVTADPWTVTDAGSLVVLTNAAGVVDTSNETAEIVTDTD